MIKQNRLKFQVWINQARQADKKGVLVNLSDKRINRIISDWHLSNTWDSEKFLFYIEQGRGVRIADILFFDGFASYLAFVVSGIVVACTVSKELLMTLVQYLTLGALTMAFFAILFKSGWDGLVGVCTALPEGEELPVSSTSDLPKEEEVSIEQDVSVPDHLKDYKARTMQAKRFINTLEQKKKGIAVDDGYTMIVD